MSYLAKLCVVVILALVSLTVVAQDIDDWGTRLSWSPDAHYIAIGFHRGDVEIRRSVDNTVSQILQIPNDSFASDVSWSPQGDFLATSSDDQKIHIWDTTTWEIVRTIDVTGEGIVSQVSWHPDNTRLAGVAQVGGGLFIWNTVTGETLSSRFVGGAFELNALDWYGEDLIIALANSTALVDPNFQIVQDIGFTDSYVTSISSDFNSSLIAGGTQFGRILVWDQSSGAVIHEFIEHNQAVFSQDWHPDDIHLASVGLDGRIIVWHTHTEQIMTEYVFPGDVTYAEWSPDGTQLAYTGIPSEDASVDLLTIVTPNVRIHR